MPVQQPAPVPELDERQTSFVSAVMIALGPLSLALYTPALPALVAAYHTTPAAVKLSLTVYFLGFCVAQLLCGSLSDAFGRKPIALIFFLLYFIGSIVAVVAPTIETLQVGRALQGIGAAAGIATSRAIVRDLFVGQTSARIMNRIGLLVALVPALSPVVGSLLLTFVSLSAIFVLMLAYAVVVIAVVLFMLPETNHNINRRYMHPVTMAQSYFTLLSDRRFIAPAGVMGLIFGGLYTMPALMPFVLIDRLGLTPLQYGVVMIFQTGALLLGNLLVGYLLRRMSARRLVPYGVGIIGFSGACFAVLHIFDSLSVIYVLAAASIWVFGIPFVSPGTMTSALSGFPQIAGAASAMIGFIQMGGGFIGSAVSAAFFTEPLTALTTVLPLAALMGVIASFWLPGPGSTAHSASQD